MIHRSAHLLVWSTAKAQSLKTARSLQSKQIHLCSFYGPRISDVSARKGHIVTRGKEIANKHGIMGKQTAFQA